MAPPTAPVARPAFAAAPVRLSPCPPVCAAPITRRLVRATGAAPITKLEVPPVARTAVASTVAHCPTLLPARLAAR
eukprot:scaffold144453_cov175-Phaeocystis_antarctica.AAC.1